jgi:predicted ATPase
MALRLDVQNFRALRSVSVEFPSGVSLLVGPNGAGKSTLLQLPALFGTAYQFGWRRALERWGGIYGFVNVEAEEGAPATLSISRPEWAWSVEFDGSTESTNSPVEMLQRDRVTVATADGSGVVVFADGDSARGAGPTLFSAYTIHRTSVRDRFMELPDEFRAYGDFPELRMLRERGSEYAPDQLLSPKGDNALTVLRNWKDRRETRLKHEFVIEALRIAFPGFEDFEFEATSNVVGARVVKQGSGTSLSLRNAANGFLHAMLCLMAVASASPRGLVTIDEPETALHPYAIRRILDAIRNWSDEHAVDVILATHSPVLINAFHENPDHLFVFEDGEPRALTEMGDGEYLARFSVGDLYAESRLGAPGKPVAEARRAAAHGQVRARRAAGGVDAGVSRPR